MITAGTFGKEHFFNDGSRLRALCNGLQKYAAKYGWKLEAWAVFSNHYHLIAHSPVAGTDGAKSLANYLGEAHQRSAAWVNKLDDQPGRKVWHNYWETLLTFEKSYLARLHYVHENPVKHGVVSDASDYPWCSAAAFKRNAPVARVKTVYSFKTDALKVLDDY
jgi:putative transposase